MKKHALLSLAAAVILLIPAAASAQSLLITEINSNGAGGDFFELTNFGSSAVNLNGARWDDNDYNFAAAVQIPGNISIAAGESIIFLADHSDVNLFRTRWNLSSNVQVIGDSSGTGLGGNDGVRLYSSTGTVLATLSYAANGFTRSNGTQAVGGHAGLSAGGAATQSLIWDPTSGTTAATARYTFANGSSLNTYANTLGSVNTGSPGVVPEPSTYALIGLGLAAMLLWSRRRPASSAR